MVNGHVRLTRSARARRKKLKFHQQQSKQQRRDDQDINPSISAMTRQYDAQQGAELSALIQAYTISEGSDSEEYTMETKEGVNAEDAAAEEAVRSKTTDEQLRQATIDGTTPTIISDSGASSTCVQPATEHYKCTSVAPINGQGPNHDDRRKI